MVGIQSDLDAREAGAMAHRDQMRLTGELATANANINSLNGQLMGANNNIATLNGQLATANGNIARLTGELATANGDVTNGLWANSRRRSARSPRLMGELDAELTPEVMPS